MTTKRIASEPELFAPLHVAVVESPIGKLWVESDGQLITRLSFEALHVRQAKVPPVLQEAQHQFDAYFRKERKTFKLPLQRKGTRFQQLVWAELDGIRFGRSRTYAEIARQIGGKAIARTVGNACGRNPFPIIVPCHRVIRSDRSLGGYGLGLPLKRKLLRLEGAG